MGAGLSSCFEEEKFIISYPSSQDDDRVTTYRVVGDRRCYIRCGSIQDSGYFRFVSNVAEAHRPVVYFNGLPEEAIQQYGAGVIPHLLSESTKLQPGSDLKLGSLEPRYKLVINAKWGENTNILPSYSPTTWCPLEYSGFQDLDLEEDLNIQSWSSEIHNGEFVVISVHDDAWSWEISRDLYEQQFMHPLHMGPCAALALLSCYSPSVVVGFSGGSFVVPDSYYSGVPRFSISGKHVQYNCSGSYVASHSKEGIPFDAVSGEKIYLRHPLSFDAFDAIVAATGELIPIKNFTKSNSVRNIDELDEVILYEELPCNKARCIVVIGHNLLDLRTNTEELEDVYYPSCDDIYPSPRDTHGRREQFVSQRQFQKLLTKSTKFNPPGDGDCGRHVLRYCAASTGTNVDDMATYIGEWGSGWVSFEDMYKYCMMKKLPLGFNEEIRPGTGTWLLHNNHYYMLSGEFNIGEALSSDSIRPPTSTNPAGSTRYYLDGLECTQKEFEDWEEADWESEESDTASTCSTGSSQSETEGSSDTSSNTEGLIPAPQSKPLVTPQPIISAEEKAVSSPIDTVVSPIPPVVTATTSTNSSVKPVASFCDPPPDPKYWQYFNDTIKEHKHVLGPGTHIHSAMLRASTFYNKFVKGTTNFRPKLSYDKAKYELGLSLPLLLVLLFGVLQAPFSPVGGAIIIGVGSKSRNVIFKALFSIIGAFTIYQCTLERRVGHEPAAFGPISFLLATLYHIHLHTILLDVVCLALSCLVVLSLTFTKVVILGTQNIQIPLLTRIRIGCRFRRVLRSSMYLFGDEDPIVYVTESEGIAWHSFDIKKYTPHTVMSTPSTTEQWDSCIYLAYISGAPVTVIANSVEYCLPSYGPEKPDNLPSYWPKFKPGPRLVIDMGLKKATENCSPTFLSTVSYTVTKSTYCLAEVCGEFPWDRNLWTSSFYHGSVDGISEDQRDIMSSKGVVCLRRSHVDKTTLVDRIHQKITLVLSSMPPAVCLTYIFCYCLLIPLNFVTCGVGTFDPFCYNPFAEVSSVNVTCSFISCGETNNGIVKTSLGFQRIITNVNIPSWVLYFLIWSLQLLTYGPGMRVGLVRAVCLIKLLTSWFSPEAYLFSCVFEVLCMGVGSSPHVILGLIVYLTDGNLRLLLLVIVMILLAIPLLTLSLHPSAPTVVTPWTSCSLMLKYGVSSSEMCALSLSSPFIKAALDCSTRGTFSLYKPPTIIPEAAEASRPHNSAWVGSVYGANGNGICFVSGKKIYSTRHALTNGAVCTFKDFSVEANNVIYSGETACFTPDVDCCMPMGPKFVDQRAYSGRVSVLGALEHRGVIVNGGYFVQSDPGDSGSPVLATDLPTDVVIGVHYGSNKSGFASYSNLAGELNSFNGCSLSDLNQRSAGNLVPLPSSFVLPSGITRDTNIIATDLLSCFTRVTPESCDLTLIIVILAVLRAFGPHGPVASLGAFSILVLAPKCIRRLLDILVWTPILVLDPTSCVWLLISRVFSCCIVKKVNVIFVIVLSVAFLLFVNQEELYIRLACSFCLSAIINFAIREQVVFSVKPETEEAKPEVPKQEEKPTPKRLYNVPLSNVLSSQGNNVDTAVFMECEAQELTGDDKLTLARLNECKSCIKAYNIEKANFDFMSAQLKRLQKNIAASQCASQSKSDLEKTQTCLSMFEPNSTVVPGDVIITPIGKTEEIKDKYPNALIRGEVFLFAGEVYSIFDVVTPETSESIVSVIKTGDVMVFKCGKARFGAITGGIIFPFSHCGQNYGFSSPPSEAVKSFVRNNFITEEWKYSKMSEEDYSKFEDLVFGKYGEKAPAKTLSSDAAKAVNALRNNPLN